MKVNKYLILFLSLIVLSSFVLTQNTEDNKEVITKNLNTIEMYGVDIDVNVAINRFQIKEEARENKLKALKEKNNKLKLFKSKAIASWYGPGFQGKLTANGEKYNMYALTCAHKTLKFGTKIKVTNLANNKSIVVRVNDRGPYIKGREIDLSKKAFTSISPIKEGILKVKLDILK